MVDTEKDVTVSSEPSQENAVGVESVLANVASNVVVETPLEEAKNSDGQGPPQEVDTPGSHRTLANTAASGSGSSTSNPPYQPKKFTSVSINKKFFERTSTAPSASQPPPSSAATKSSTSASRPAVQPSSSHSRLVTTKLTATQSSGSGSGWSRPSSATPPAPSTSSSLPSAPAPSGPSVTPQMPHAGKVIQPQPRTVASGSSAGGSQKDGSGSAKPAWGNVKVSSVSASSTAVRATNDFPTAAEVAQVVTPVKATKPSDTKDPAEIAAANKQARMEEADTFRGVHLDPNAHHWDEMPEDDDNFLDGVIEFGDGRQYKIQAVEPPQPSSPPGHSRSISQDESLGDASAAVSKEERFADDFDRSWPRSRPSPSLSSREFSARAPTSPSSSQAVHSPQESSRVLFNERSNRLEPYSNAPPSYRPSQPSYPPKRGSQSDASFSPTESRSGRDLPPHSQAHGGYDQGPPHGERPWGRRDDVPTSPRTSLFGHKRGDQHHDNHHFPPPASHGERDREHTSRRSSTIGPSPILSPRSHPKDMGRAMPHHPPQALPPSSPSQRRPPSLYPSSRTPLPRDALFPTVPHSAHPSLPSPGQPQTVVISLNDPPPLLSGISDQELEEVRKDVMQSAAVRAKERRRQEEEEREREKERARRKAAELEEKMKMTEKDKANRVEQETPAAEVNQSIGDSITQVNVQPGTNAPSDAPLRQTSSGPQPVNNAPRRPPSLKGIPRQPSEPLKPRRTSQSSASMPSASMPPPSPAERWRVKPNPPVSSAAHGGSSLPPLAPFPSFAPSLLQLDAGIAVDQGEELEVVEFSDLGKLFGANDASVVSGDKEDQLSGPVSSARPSASGSFDDGTEYPQKTARPWRRKSSHDIGHDLPLMPANDRIDALPTADALAGEATRATQPDSAWTEPRPGTPSFTREMLTPGDQHRYNFSHSSVPSGSYRNQRGSDMSAWDDAMSRIKGALDVMQAGEASKGQNPSGPAEVDTPSTSPNRLSVPPAHLPPKLTREPRWVPPALRERRSITDIQSCEVFDITGQEPSRSPPVVVVLLPTLSRPIYPLNKKQHQQAKSQPAPVRWDILSWDPPVEYMSRRDFSLNDVLFHKPFYKGKFRLRVMLPASRPRPNETTPSMVGPRVSLPAQAKPLGVGAFGRSSAADGVSTWRKPKSPSFSKVDISDNSTPDTALNTTSKSPPPQMPSNPAADTLNPDISITAKADNPPSLIRPRLQPPMPAGSAVAFYRDSRVDVVDADADTTVKFIVNSELDEPQPPSASTGNPVITLSSPSSTSFINSVESAAADGVGELVVNGLKSPPASPRAMVPSHQNKLDSKGSDDSMDRAAITPSNHQTTSAWGIGFGIKESPARPPDPEHLKAVWSQASDKALLPAHNSLEGIADDLTALPFILQDVKSEDGETPPPSIPSAPSRMSLHDVTRAFQQVPVPSSSSSVSNRGPPLSPTPPTAPLASRQPNYAYAFPHPQFGPYSSPSSTMGYPHPVTPSVSARMPANGHAALYGQSVWMPPPGTPLSTQNQTRMMRPLASPYSAPLMAYPTPNTPSGFPPSLPGTMPNAQQQNGSQAQGHVALMSPIMPHATAHTNMSMYGASPVLMHTPLAQMPQGPTYLSVPPGRRSDVTHSPMQQPLSIHSPSHNNGYAAIPPPAPYVRPTW